MLINTGRVLFEALEKIHANSYFDMAPKEAATLFPYAVFKLPFNNAQEIHNEIIFDIDVYDNKSNNITDLETITQNIADYFDHSTYFDNEMLLEIYLESIQQIPTLEDQIKRRQIRFTIKQFKGG